MKFSDFILVDAIRAHIDAKDKEGIIRELVKSIQDAGGIEESAYEDIVSAVLSRERQSTTGMGAGLAFPHAKHPGIKKTVGTVAVCREGVDFDSLDGDKVYLIALILSSSEQPAEHTRAMALISEQFKDDAFRCYLTQARDCGQIKRLLDDADNGEFAK